MCDFLLCQKNDERARRFRTMILKKVRGIQGHKLRFQTETTCSGAKEDCGDLSRKSIGNLHAVAAGAALQSFQEERSLRFRLREFKRFEELFGSRCIIAQSHLELAGHGVE
jgi:hypothetical protein